MTTFVVREVGIADEFGGLTVCLAEEADEFNANIVGTVEGIAEYDGTTGGEPIERAADSPWVRGRRTRPP